MKITPIEIRQHTFEKSLRGYRVDEVDAFLASLSQEWERVVGESKMLKMQLELAEKELNKLKEVELTLFRTLKNAEDNSNQIAEQANRQAEQYMVEARQRADEQTAAAKKKSAVMIQDAENQAHYVRETLSVELKSLEQDFKAMERYKDNLMVQIRALATNAMESVDRFEKKFAKQQARQKFDDPTGEPAAETSEPAAEATPPAAPPAEATEEPRADHTDQPTESTESTVFNLPADAEIPANLAEATNAPQQSGEPIVVAGAEASEEQAASNNHRAEASGTSTAPETETAEKKGGSFFDQI